MNWHSEYGQDRWLAEQVFGGRRGGVFVEAGALDGILHSNTLYFERECGWRGILIEPNPAWQPRLHDSRPLARIFECALAAAAGTAAFEVSAVAGWSGLARHPHARRRGAERRLITVPTRSLASVLDEAGVAAVDYLSLDIEGGETEVLAAFPFDRIPVAVIGVEDNDGDNEALRLLLAGRGYRHLARVGVDEFWQRNP